MDQYGTALNYILYDIIDIDLYRDNKYAQFSQNNIEIPTQKMVFQL